MSTSPVQLPHLSHRPAATWACDSSISPPHVLGYSATPPKPLPHRPAGKWVRRAASSSSCHFTRRRWRSTPTTRCSGRPPASARMQSCSHSSRWAQRGACLRVCDVMIVSKRLALVLGGAVWGGIARLHCCDKAHSSTYDRPEVCVMHEATSWYW